MTERPCPNCGEPVPLDASACPHCRQDLRLDLWLAHRGPASGREIYAAARALEELAGPGEFLALKRVLESGDGLLLSGLTPGRAAEANELLTRHGAEGRLAPHVEVVTAVDTAGPRRVHPVVWPLAAVAGAVLLVVWLWPERGPKGPGTPVVRPVSAPAAAAMMRQLSAREVGSLVAASAASLRCADSLGSGFFVAPDRLVTNAHVLCPGSAPMRVVLSDGRQLTGVPERSDRWLDIALVRVAGAGAPGLTLGDASTLRQGDQLYFYGSPRGLDFTLSGAMVSHTRRSMQGIAYLQLDGNVNPGNSGGPLLGPNGAVVGIVTAMVGEASGLGLALPINYLYEGEQPLVASPPEADRVAWKKLIGEVSAEEEREVAEARESMSRPALVAALMTSETEVVALVARESNVAPMSEHLNFRLEGRPGEVACMPAGEATQWSPAGALAGQALDERTRMWFEKHHLDTEVWASVVRLDWSACPPPEQSVGSDLVLVEGAPAGDRATITLPRTAAAMPFVLRANPQEGL